MPTRKEAKKLGEARSAAQDAWMRGDRDKAIAAYKQHIADLERILGPNHRDIGPWRATLQNLYSYKTIDIQKQLVADRESVLGPYHPDTLIARVRLQEMLYAMQPNGYGLRSKAQEQLAAECARVLGPDHPDTFSIWALTQPSDQPRDPGEDLSMAEQLAADCERILGRDHPTTCTLKRRVAALWNESLPPLYDDPSWR